MAKILRGLNGREYPVELQADFTPHNRFGDGVRTNTPAAVESRAVLARRLRGHALGPVRLVPKDPAQP
ncbi:hypothetical protein [Actinomycetospora cinnamomea]|uniref:Uncharacterized protein n=1 Tax=Actinomycetospora cinnamomea TaxID=663609 RepID=A0A2U1FD72_9PSEU|nr:hypothetical protein [Actinomycetospora cinnamomea]PVZ10163.1 hypothetical protein C8D89_105240 [Actinomycetospora cinnamomea]